jgi:hypothetical protein
MALTPDEQAELDALMQKSGLKPEASAAPKAEIPRPKQSTGSALAGVAQNLGQGATFAWGDDIGNAIAKPITYGLKNMLPASMGGEDVSYSQVSDFMDKNKANVMAPMNDFNAENPITGGALQAVGGIASGVGFGKLAGAALPEGATSALAAFAKAHPYLASAGIGGGTGAIYGAGAGEGSLSERGSSAAAGGVGGALGGMAGTFVGRNIAAPLASKVDEAYQGSALQKMFGGADDAVTSVAETAPADIASIQKPSGEFFSKTAGERTQKAKLQTLEADAVGGRFGDEPRAMMANARSIQNQERTAFIKALDPKATDGSSVNDVLDGVYSRVKGQADTLKKQVTNAYDIARQGNGVKIRADDVNTGLMSEIGRVRAETAVNLSDKVNYSKANAVLDALAEKMQGTSLSKVTAVKLGDLEDWRKTLSGYQNDATGTEKAFLGKVKNAYDSFMIKTANEAADLGDAEAIKAFRNAVSLRAQYGSMFEKNAITEAVANGASPDDFAKSLIGSGAINGKKGMMDNVQALINAGGAEADAVKADMSAAFAKRLFTKAANGFEEGKPDVAFISPAKMASGLEEMFVSNKELGKFLFGEDAAKAAGKAISELKLIASKQPSTQNPSGSGYMIARVLRDTGITKIPVLSFLNDAANSAGRSKGQAAVEKSLQDFINNNAPKSALFSAAGGLGGGVSGGAVVNVNSKEP